jgi:beta-lactamase superfamily II metal-dependent hydrolase
MATGFQLDFHPVGDTTRSGDAITVRYGTPGVYSIHVIDGGTQETGDRLVEFIREYYDNPQRIDAVICTHGDDDHSSGLRTIIENFEIGTIYMNRPWLYAAEILHLFEYDFTVPGLERSLRQAFPILAEIEELAAERNIEIREAFQGTVIGKFTILAPSRERYLALVPQFSRTPEAAEPAPQTQAIPQIIRRAAQRVLNWIPESWELETLEDLLQEPTTPSNESSVVQYADMGDSRILLTADAGVDALTEAANYAALLGIPLPGLTFMQMPHHGSRHNVSRPVLNAWLGYPLPNGTQANKTSYVSVGRLCETHPRRKVVNAFKRRGARVYLT